jgi:DNA mismatch repair protein MSH2
MSNCNFDFTEKYFVLCSVNLTISNGFLNFGVAIIDSYNSKVKILEFADNDFFTQMENLLIQIAPAHEETNFFVIGNFQMDFHAQKFSSIIEKIEMVDNKCILINSKEFVNKNIDFFSTIKLLLLESESEQHNLILTKNDLLQAVNTLHGTIGFTRILQYESFQNKFLLEKYNLNECMSFDVTCVKCLNLFDSLEDKKVLMSGNLSRITLGANSNNSNANRTSVYSILNTCCTKFGSRMLRSWLIQPLQNVDDINTRLNIVELLLSSVYFKQEIRDTYLSKIDDIQTINMSLAKYISKGDEKLVKLMDCAKLQNCVSICRTLLEYIKGYEGVNAELFFERYVNTLEELLKRLTKLEEMLSKTIMYDQKNRDYGINYALNKDLATLQEKIDVCWESIDKVRLEVERMIGENKKQKPKVKITEYDKAGFTIELIKSDGESFMKYNDHGFKLISSNKNYITIQNKKLQELSAEIKELKNDYKEKEKFYAKKVIDVTSTYHPLLERLVYLLSELDVLAAFANVIQNSKETYTKPILKNPEESRNLILKDSRHFVLEWNEDIIKKNNPNNKNLISNDCLFKDGMNIKLLTGINMGGKSTYLRQVGICVVLAHIGMYIPASYAEIPIIDQIFTRVGAGDIMLKGISTYMNEMIEVCSLIKSASKNSLMLIDELGRGTSTDDGIGISYGILHHISMNIDCFCLFATHFFELTDMEKILKNVENYFVSYCVQDGQLFMEYKILKGKTNNSFGVNLFKSLKFDDDTCQALEKFLKE